MTAARNDHEDLERVLNSPTRILVVDDEEAALAVIPETLRDGLEERGWKKLTIETAESGEEALEVASGDLHLLVADVVMPGIDGIETYAQLKDRYIHLACVVMTAHAPEHITPIRAMRLGAADYVKKPISPEYLVETCHRQLIVNHLRRAADESRLLTDAIVASVGDAVIALSNDRILSINAAAREIVGDDPGEILNRIETLGIAAARPGPNESTSRTLHNLEIPSALGRNRSVSVVGSPVIDSTGHRLGDVLVIHDITRPMEERSLESFKRMAAIAAHEMKNSVTGLGLVTQHLVARLQDGRLDPNETQRMAEIILDSVARLNRFARRFLDFSKIPEPKLGLTDPNALVTQALDLYSQETGLPDWVTVSTQLGDGLPQVMADKDLMFQVLQNLIINAIEAMEEASEGTIQVTTDKVDDHIRIAVTDNGSGVAAHMQERIFEPNVTTREAGSGLGLVMVRDVVHRHQGKVRLVSTSGEGATFEIYLPIAKSSA